ncbi:response regulator transcription factor [Streptomyces sp. NPDC053474]|uniref:response regulator transcription factor n=1 Tax=Streptomyces sp. NPDC053474 TaxID=3365704 RepID=UPI0037D3FEC7
MIRVVVVDDEALARSGFPMVLNASDGIEVVATAQGAQAADVVRRELPDVVPLDIRMPDVDGLTAPRSGASGFLLKDAEPEQLAQLVRTLAAGGVVVSPKASRALLRSHPAAGAPRDADVSRVGFLSDRERDVLVLVAEGLSNADIGTRIHLSAGTVKDHVSSILAKLRVSSRGQAALLAERAGLLTHNDDNTARDNGR